MSSRGCSVMLTGDMGGGVVKYGYGIVGDLGDGWSVMAEAGVEVNGRVLSDVDGEAVVLWSGSLKCGLGRVVGLVGVM